MGQMTILIAGPYRSNTGDDPVKMRENLRLLEEHALKVYHKGHLPLIGEWVALPLMTAAGSRMVGDPVYQEFAYPVAVRMLAMVDAVYRIEGDSTGADEDVRLANERGIPVYAALAEIPEA